MERRRVTVQGAVQGVGFRFTVKQIARGFDVAGWVQNLDDGRVELQAAGEPEEVGAFLAAIAESELKSHIKQIAVCDAQLPPDRLRGFEIVR